MEVITDGILIALYLWATVAVIKQGTWNKQQLHATCTSEKRTADR